MRQDNCNNPLMCPTLPDANSPHPHPQATGVKARVQGSGPLPLLRATAGGPGDRRLGLGRLRALLIFAGSISRGRQFSFLAAGKRVTGSVRRRGAGPGGGEGRMQMALEVMGAMESQARGRACSGEGSQAPQTVTGDPQREGLTHTGDWKRDDVMRLVSGKEQARTTVHTDRISTL